jgi:HK97 family phage portal protein
VRLFGFNITRSGEQKALDTVSPGRGGWFPMIREYFAGAWQQNAVPISAENVLANHAVFACQTLIASDISKLRVKLVKQDKSGIWSETVNPAYSPVLRKPNGFQTRIQFFENWVLSKLQRGNTYVLKRRDGRGVVVALYVLSPDLVTPLVSESGEVFYELRADNLSGLTERIIAPAREIIHDRFNCFFHPLVGLSPIFANGLAATHGLAIQNSSTVLFQNGARPGGILTAPGNIGDETAKRLKDYWDQNFSGSNAGKVAVLGDGLKYEAMAVKAVDAQLIEQLKWTAEIIASTYHVPAYKVGAGQMPTVNNVQSLNVEYYSQCLQVLIEAIELCLDEGLATGEKLGTEFDLDGLLRMDSVTQMDVIERSKNVLTLDERRRRLDAPGIKGGATVYLQQQDHSIEAIAARDAMLIEQANNSPAEPKPAESPANDNAAAQRQASMALSAQVRRTIREKRLVDA